MPTKYGYRRKYRRGRYGYSYNRRGYGRSYSKAVFGPSVNSFRASYPYRYASFFRKHAKDPTVKRLFSLVVLTTDSLGQLEGAIDNNPSGYTAKSQYQDLYEQYRCIGWKVTYVPFDTTCVNNIEAPLYFYQDNNDGAAPTSYSDLASFPNVKILPSNRTRVMYFRTMNGAAWNASNSYVSGLWEPTSAYAATSWLRYYGKNLKASATYGNLHVELYVQYKEEKV